MPVLPIETSDSGVKLSPSPIEPSWIIDGNPQASACLLSKSADRSAWTVVWECTKGRFNWYYDLDETIMVLEGAIILESDNLPPTRYGVGSVILFRKGAHARWYVEDYVKKLAFCRRAHPLPLAFVLRGLAFLNRKVFGAAKGNGVLSPAQTARD